MYRDQLGEASTKCINYYAKRWTIEPGFRDEKNLRFGMGLSALRIADPQRRDRLLLLSALAVVLLTLLGAAGESLGMDRLLKSNTSKPDFDVLDLSNRSIAFAGGAEHGRSTMANALMSGAAGRRVGSPMRRDRAHAEPQNPWYRGS